LITSGATRDEARKRMIRAIDEYDITGIKTTLPFCKYVFEHDAFIDGSFDTKFVEKHFDSNSLKNQQPVEEKIAASMAAMLFNESSQQSSVGGKAKTKKSNWRQRALK